MSKKENKQQKWERLQKEDKVMKDAVQSQIDRQKDFKERAKAASVEIAVTLKKYEIDVVCESTFPGSDITLTIPMKFTDKKPVPEGIVTSIPPQIPPELEDILQP